MSAADTLTDEQIALVKGNICKALESAMDFHKRYLYEDGFDDVAETVEDMEKCIDSFFDGLYRLLCEALVTLDPTLPRERIEAMFTGGFRRKESAE